MIISTGICTVFFHLTETVKISLKLVETVVWRKDGFFFLVFMLLKYAVLTVLWEEKSNKTAVLISVVWAIGYKISDVSLAAVFGL